MDKTMMLVTADWKTRKTFKMIPISPNAVYNEAIFDMDEKVLALISKEKKQSFHMMPKLGEDGTPIRLKGSSNRGDYQKERKTLETYYEYYVDNPVDISNIINLLAINASQFDFKSYLENAYEAQTESAAV